MNKLFITALLCAAACAVEGQTPKPKTPVVQAFGKVDQADLELKSCDFEKDANAEVLQETGDIYFGADIMSITNEVHKRIKIFNTNGNSEADIKINFYSGDHLEYITGIQAETINLTDGKVEITKLDKKLIYTKVLDKEYSEITFTMPNVKPGSIIEYKYNWNSSSFVDMPDLYFQEKIPVRYCEYTTRIPDVFYFRPISNLSQALDKYVKNSEGKSLIEDGQTYPFTEEIETKGIANVHSLPDEPYMSSFTDNVQSLRFQLVSIRPIGGFQKSYSDTWAKVGGRLIDDEDFGGQLKRKLNGEEAIIAKAKSLTSNNDKIAYIFNQVRDAMKWNESDRWYTNDGTYRAWENKTGNSTEINIILYHLLKQSGIDAYPMVVSTREHGKVNPFYTSLAQFNRTVVYIPIDTANRYILDATGKYNVYNETPQELLNSTGLYIDKSNNKYDIIRIQREAPVRLAVMVNAEIKANGKVEGSAQISNTSYNRMDAVEKYKKDGEKKYIDYLTKGDNNLKISSIKFDNMEVDTLPLTQNINFSLDLPAADENYIYLTPTIFTPLETNPFLSENRITNIDFVYRRSYAMNGLFKIPAGYKVDAKPQNISMTMPDKSFSFRRIVVEQDGQIMIRYSVAFNVPEYSKEFYPDFYQFFKKMTEMMNEQIVLKKS
jgi:hypothetical protein